MSIPRRPHALVALLLLSCGVTRQEESSDRSAPEAEEAWDAEPAPQESAGGMPSSPPAKRKLDELRGAEGKAMPDRFAEVRTESDDAAPGDAANGDLGESAQAPTRSWFPETFLFAPAVVTDEAGRAEVPVIVPDRLTSWRVLALAHDRQGHQAGDVSTFQGSLPVYVEPVLPDRLAAGDRVQLPLTVVNRTDAPWSGRLDVDVTGATEARWSGAVTVPAGGSEVLTVPLSTPRAGALQVALSLGDADAVVRQLEVRPTGKRIEQVRTGTLAAPRAFELEGAPTMDPASARLRLAVSPGALALLRRELARVEGIGGDLATDAAALYLAGAATALLTQLGEAPDQDRQESISDLGMIATQRILRHARSPDLVDAARLLPAAAAHPDNPVLSRLRDRLVSQLARGQRPDGTFMESGERWTVQRMLAATARATAAVGQAAPDSPEARRVRLSAGAAFERQAAQLRDPYTAALVLSSGAASPALTETLRGLVQEAAIAQPDGSKAVPAPAEVRRPDGSRPTTIETTARAAVAMAEAGEQALAADLAAHVLGAWRPGLGWGDGTTDLAALQAVATILRDPLPDEILVVLERDGAERTRGVLRGERRSDLLLLELPGAEARGMHTWTVRAEPAVPGLAFALSLQTWVPWPDPPQDAGVEVALDLPPTLALGRSVPLQLDVSAPARTALELALPLPAGVQVDTDALSALVAEGRLASYEAQEGLVTLSVPPQDATRWSAVVPVIPTLAGTLHAAAVQLTLPSRPGLELATPQAAWVVRTPGS